MAGRQQLLNTGGSPQQMCIHHGTAHKTHQQKKKIKTNVRSYYKAHMSLLFRHNSTSFRELTCEDMVYNVPLQLERHATVFGYVFWLRVAK